MSNKSNFFRRALTALIDGRTRQAERYIAQYWREDASSETKVNER
ncbi:hypothetical protein [Devosia soli]|nr:hypothetical protein [Devosia soli]